MSVGFKRREGQGVYVDHQLFKVERIHSKSEATLRRSPDGRSIQVTDDRSVEIVPTVRVSIGTGSQGRQVHLAFEAPRTVSIVREELYRSAG